MTEIGRVDTGHGWRGGIRYDESTLGSEDETPATEAEAQRRRRGTGGLTNTDREESWTDREEEEGEGRHWTEEKNKPAPDGTRMGEGKMVHGHHDRTRRRKRRSAIVRTAGRR